MIPDTATSTPPVAAVASSATLLSTQRLCNLLPNVEAAKCLRTQTFTLAEFLTEVGEQLPEMTLHRRALVHGHCHHKAIIGMHAERCLLDRLGMPYSILDSGCCGMAGFFGFEREHYDISQAVGERVLLIAVRGAPHDVLIVADAFSCREQIAQSTNRRALHLAEVLRMAMEEGPKGPRETFRSGATCATTPMRRCGRERSSREPR